MKIYKLADSEHSMKEQFETNLNNIIEYASQLKKRNVKEEDLEGWTMDKISTAKDDIADVKHFYSDQEVDIDIHASNKSFSKLAQNVDPKLVQVVNQVVKETQIPKNKLLEVVDSLLRNLGDRYSMSQIKGLIDSSTQEQQTTQQTNQQVQQTNQQVQQTAKSNKRIANVIEFINCDECGEEVNEYELVLDKCPRCGGDAHSNSRENS